jgi:hypothetical protein
MNCFLCGEEVRMEVVRPTKPGDWEYRYQSLILRYWVPGTEEIHHCRLKPRLHMAAQPPQEPDTPLYEPRRMAAPITPQEAPTSAQGFMDVE